jgi:hypothetical protein
MQLKKGKSQNNYNHNQKSEKIAKKRKGYPQVISDHT